MKHKTLSLYVPCLEGGCEDAGRIELEGYILISEERLYDLEAAEQDALEQARLNGMGASRELALMARIERLEHALRAMTKGYKSVAYAQWPAEMHLADEVLKESAK